MNFIFVFILLTVCESVLSMPCLTSKSKQDFTKARNALKSLESFLKNQATAINQKVKQLDNDMVSMEEDFKKRQWRKHNGHCYYFGSDKMHWTLSERRCREIGGYSVKIDDASENSWIQQQLDKKNDFSWMGLIDVVNGDWKWIYDQTAMNYTNFVGSGRPYPTSNTASKEISCVVMDRSGKWHDTICNNSFVYICESNFCFS